MNDEERQHEIERRKRQSELNFQRKMVLEEETEWLNARDVDQRTNSHEKHDKFKVENVSFVTVVI